MTDTLRAFIAFDLPAPLRGRIRRLQEQLQPYRLPVRWVRPEAVHLTMKFLGNIRMTDVRPISTLLNAAVEGFGPMPLTAKGLGVFPNLERPRILWIGLWGAVKELRSFYLRLNEDLAALGFPKENRPFKAHLTLGRIKGRIPEKRLAEIMKTFGGFESEPFVADRIVLFQSDLRPSGAVYTELRATDMENKPKGADRVRT
jgi:RNA 2',3'-cyclic 3'-phosphodiesterase